MRAGTLRREFDAELTSRVAVFAAEIKPTLDRLDVARAIAEQPNVPATPVTVRRGDGTLVYESPDVPHLTDEWERAAAQGAAKHLGFQTVRDATRQEQRLVNRFLTSPDGYPYVVQLMASPTSIDEGVRELAVSQGIGILLILALATYGSAMTARQALAPIDEIIRRGREIHGHEPGKRLEVEADTIELAELVASMNAMLDRLEEPVHTAHRFAANVSHELQTPLAAMRFAIEAAQRSNRPAEKYQQIADDLLSEVDRLSTLVRDLRLLAIAGAGQLVGQPEHFDLGDVVQQCCEIARAVADSAEIEIEEEVLPGVLATGSALHLRRVILNLTDNAIRYSPRGSRVARANGVRSRRRHDRRQRSRMRHPRPRTAGGSSSRSSAPIARARATRAAAGWAWRSRTRSSARITAAFRWRPSRTPGPRSRSTSPPSPRSRTRREQRCERAAASEPRARSGAWGPRERACRGVRRGEAPRLTMM